MRRLTLTILFLLALLRVNAQLTSQDVDELNNSRLEDVAETEEAESEDDYDIQELREYRRHPLNVNGAADALNNFPLLDPLLISNLIQYRSTLGDLINIYELQAVPGFTPEIVKKIFPFVTIKDESMAAGSLAQRFKKGEHSLLIRPVIVPEKAEGFRNEASDNHFIGSRAALFVRYKYQYRHLLQYGFTGDKDAGEPLIAGKVPFIMDFTSFHLFLRNCKWIKALAIGDYTVNLGQGLIHWQSQAFKKSAEVLSIKRQSEILRPYQSAGEYNFQRGVAATITLHNTYELTLFGSYRKLNVNLDENDSLGTVITSIITSGLNRSTGEIADKNKATLVSYGGTLQWKTAPGHISLNLVKYQYSLPLLKSAQPYNIFAIKGKEWLNYSIDYSFTKRNIHGFGELATDARANRAFIGGLLASLNAIADVAIVYREISKRYQSIYGNAFTESTLPSNENGFYTGISIKPDYRWKIDGYIDLFSFPWLKYRVDAPASGAQYLVQIMWKPAKSAEVYSRFRLRLKPLNITGEEKADYPQRRIIRNWRTQVALQATPSILLRSRVETTSYLASFDGRPEEGFLCYVDLIYKPKSKPFSGNFRIARFETGGYDSRIYAYENDLLYVSSTPSFFDRGTRCYVNFAAKPQIRFVNHLQLSFSLKLATTFYTQKNEIGSGLSTIHGNRRSDLRFQLLLMPKT
jgi:hypothetical protein